MVGLLLRGIEREGHTEAQSLDLLPKPELPEAEQGAVTFDTLRSWQICQLPRNHGF